MRQLEYAERMKWWRKNDCIWNMWKNMSCWKRETNGLRFQEDQGQTNFIGAYRYACGYIRIRNVFNQYAYLTVDQSYATSCTTHYLQWRWQSCMISLEFGSCVIDSDGESLQQIDSMWRWDDKFYRQQRASFPASFWCFQQNCKIMKSGIFLVAPLLVTAFNLALALFLNNRHSAAHATNPIQPRLPADRTNLGRPSRRHFWVAFLR